MPSFFTDPYPDELLYSACARFSSCMRFPNNASASESLFGSKNVPAVVDLPGRISNLIEALPQGHKHTVDDLIDKNTLLPFYAQFISDERLAAAREDMREAKGNHVYERLGITAGLIRQPEWLRFCPQCVTEDRMKFHEAYWHRAHQFTGVEVCSTHQLFLEASQVPWRNKSQPSTYYDAEMTIQHADPRPLDMSDRRQAALLKVAQSTTWLLSMKSQLLKGGELRERYYQLLLERGYAYYNGRIRMGKLAADISRLYTSEYLEQLGCPIKNVHHSWLARLVLENKVSVVQHPLLHLLLMAFMDRTAEEVFTTFAKFKPFGDGPWPCFNRVAEHYEHAVVVDCRVIDSPVKGKRGRPMGVFTCPCGFIYTRMGPDCAPEDRVRVDSIREYGPMWESALCQLWENNRLTIRETAKRLGVNELTVKRRAIHLGLTYPRNTPGSLRANSEVNVRYIISRKSPSQALENYRSKWRAISASNPEARRQQLIEIAPSVYQWLRNHDSEWLEQQLPSPLKSLPVPETVDWKSVDIQLGPAVATAAQTIKDRRPPVRVSISAIIEAVGRQSWLEKNLDKLPRIAKALEGGIESREEFLIRRIEWVEECFRDQIEPPTRSQFERLAGTKNKVGRMPLIQEAVDFAMNRLEGKSE